MAHARCCTRQLLVYQQNAVLVSPATVITATKREAFHMDTGLLVSIAATSIALAGVIMAMRQLRISREMRAQDAYEAYHHLGLQYPELGTGLLDSARASELDRRRYVWFVLSMLLTVERILTLFPRDRHWRSALEDDIRTHAKLIGSTEFAPHRESLDPKVVKLIDHVLLRIPPPPNCAAS